MKFWYEKDGKPVECTIQEWSAYMATADRIVARAEGTYRGQEILVSSVFVGIIAPYETALFVGKNNPSIVRSETREEAMDHFKMAVDEIETRLGFKLADNTERKLLGSDTPTDDLT